MNYKIIGEPMSSVVFDLDKGEQIVCESGSMCWMNDAMTLESSAGGFGKAFGRFFSGENMFRNTYTSQSSKGQIALASSFIGSIRAIKVTRNEPVIAQKGAFLASYGDIETSAFFQKKLSSGLFGGEGFVMQKFAGEGIVFVEIDGYAVDYYLNPGEKMIVQTGSLALMDSSCDLDIVSVKGIKNKLFSGEGLFNTIITGPGKIVVQTMPVSKFANTLLPYLPTPSSGSSSD